MAQGGRSKVWDYFTKDPSGTVICNICAGSVSQGSSSLKQKNTTNLWAHLKVKHKEAYHVAYDKAAQPKEDRAQSQPTLKQVLDKTTKWTTDDRRTKELDKMIMEMIATDILPYAVVEGAGFKRLLAKAEPRYPLKSEKYFRTQLLDQIYSQVVTRIKQLISVENAGNSITFTTDCWSGSTEALMSLTAHFIDENWNRVQTVLNVKAMSGSHTGEYIGQMFLTMLEEWNIDTQRVLLVLRDSGANMVKGMRLAEMPDLSCSAHTLQLIINDGLSSQRVVGDILAKLKRIATHFNHSVIAQQRLSVIQKEVGVPQHSILQAVPTRWNSTLHMLLRMLEQKRAITAYSSDHGHFTCPTADEWDVAANLAETLTPLEEITKEMSKADSSASCIIPCVGVLKCLLESQGPTSKGIQTLRKTMLESLNKRFSKLVKESKEVVLACLLDPRYKERPLSAETLTQAKAWLREETEMTPPDPTPTESASEEGDPKRQRVEDQAHSLLDSLYDTMLTSTSHAQAPEGILEELERYMSEPVIDRKRGNPLEWWKHNNSRFKGLSCQARRYLSCPPSSVPSERVFSTIGNIYEEKRSTLKGENAEKLCFLHYNLPLLDWQY
ncbi:zinc finger BED domain-containing protein 4-like [Paramisgurnus dabryanus]|uniref:zinc finger BED domain-containing protein 4-like n=1 Tax=Paramisgurnus dabryanus TaxID=90735 RepID=UPI003CCF8CD6